VRKNVQQLLSLHGNIPLSRSSQHYTAFFIKLQANLQKAQFLLAGAHALCYTEDRRKGGLYAAFAL
jgi:hypothetical protein